MRRSSRAIAGPAWVAAAACTLLLGCAALAVALGPGRLTTQAGSAPALTIVVVATLIGGSAAARLGPAGTRVGRLALAAAVCWTGPVWLGWSDGPAGVRAAGALVGPFLLPVVIALVADGTRVAPRAGRVVVRVALVEAVVDALGHAALDDPTADPDCWARCVPNVLLVGRAPAVLDAIDAVSDVVLLAAGLLIAAAGLLRIAGGYGPARLRRLAGATGAAVLGGSLVLRAGLLLALPETSADAVFRVAYAGTAAGLVLIAAGPVTRWWGALAQRRSAARLVAALGGAPGIGALEDRLRRVVGDPLLQVLYADPTTGGLVDAHGRQATAPPPGDPARRVTTVTEDARRVAVIVHADEVTDAVLRLGAGTRLALANEGLRALLLARADQLRRSRRRVVEAGDLARRSFERDLHDGAQQRLLILSARLRAASAVAAVDDPAIGARLEAMTGDALQGLDDLRDLARRMHPAILEQAGLGPALESLADTAAARLSVEVDLIARPGARVETTSYAVVVDAVEAAIARGANDIRIRIAEEQDRIVITVEDDVRADDVPISVVDRAEAADGSVSSRPGRLRVELPCG